VDEIRWKKILEENRNLTCAQLSRKVGCSRQWVWLICKKLNFSLPLAEYVGHWGRGGAIATPEKARVREASYLKEYQRKNIIGTTRNGKFVRIKCNKRPRPEYCEICNKKPREPNFKEIRLNYHHWNDEHPEWGIWCCGACHLVVGGYENGRIEKYLDLKKKVEGILTNLTRQRK
jgi:hypothetical protein